MATAAPSPDAPTRSHGARDRLVAGRRATLVRIEALERDIADIVESARAGATDDEHDPEGATIAFERAQAMALLDESRVQLDQLDLALARVDAGSYWACESCGGEIGAARLDVRPSATRCIGCATRKR